LLIFVFIFIFVILILILLILLIIFTFFLVFSLMSLTASVSLIPINVFLYVIFTSLSVGPLGLNIGIVVLVFLFLVNPAATRRLFKKCEQLYRSQPVDLVYTHLWLDILLIRLLYRRGIKVIVLFVGPKVLVQKIPRHVPSCGVDVFVMR
jgi:hypothetical protein